MTTELQQRARKRLRRIQRARAQPRYRRVLGKFVEAGLLEAPGQALEQVEGPVELQDVLWAGEYEPRLLELLPAVLLKRPGLLSGADTLPDDLAEVLKAIRFRRQAPSFRGVDAASYLPWVGRVGRRGKEPSLLKSFRFRAEDVDRLKRLKARLPSMSETDLVRTALRAFERALEEADE